MLEAGVHTRAPCGRYTEKETKAEGFTATRSSAATPPEPFICFGTDIHVCDFIK